jgi:hypothetical protein
MFTLASRAAMAAPLMGGLYAKGKKDAADKKFQEDLDSKVKEGYRNPGNEGRRKAAMPPESDDDSDKANAGIFTAGKQVPQDIDSASAPVKKAKGGSISSASSRADGCCTKGKTRGKMM